jgi:hypothetical protein
MTLIIRIITALATLVFTRFLLVTEDESQLTEFVTVTSVIGIIQSLDFGLGINRLRKNQIGFEINTILPVLLIMLLIFTGLLYFEYNVFLTLFVLQPYLYNQSILINGLKVALIRNFFLAIFVYIIFSLFRHDISWLYVVSFLIVNIDLFIFKKLNFINQSDFKFKNFFYENGTVWLISFLSYFFYAMDRFYVGIVTYPVDLVISQEILYKTFGIILLVISVINTEYWVLLKENIESDIPRRNLFNGVVLLLLLITPVFNFLLIQLKFISSSQVLSISTQILFIAYMFLLAQQVFAGSKLLFLGKLKSVLLIMAVLVILKSVMLIFFVRSLNVSLFISVFLLLISNVVSLNVSKRCNNYV